MIDGDVSDILTQQNGSLWDFWCQRVFITTSLGVSLYYLLLNLRFCVVHVQEKVISIFTVETHLHKALTFYVQYAFVLYSIGAFSIIYISACTRVLTSLKKLGHFNNVGIILVCSVCLHVCKKQSVCKTVCVFRKRWSNLIISKSMTC